MISSKDRVLTVLDNKIPDRIPVTNRFTPEIESDLKKILGLPSSVDNFELEVQLGHDMLCTKEIGIVNAYTLESSRPIGEGLYIDDFGIIKKKVNYNGGSYIEIVKNPLADLDKFSSYALPNPDNQELLLKQYSEYQTAIRNFGKSHAIVGGVTCTILEGVEMLRGISRMMVDFIENQEFIEALMDKLVDYHLKIGKKLIELGVDIIYIGDDAGMQTGMLIDPDQWRKLLKPRYDYLFREWKKINGNIYFAFHSDGYVEPIVGDLVEIGLDILNPVQPNTMDDNWLKKQFGDKLTFWGGINVQKTIPFGTPKEVIDEVRDRINVFGPGGGYIISPSHNVQPNKKSLNNTLIFYWAANKYCEY